MRAISYNIRKCDRRLVEGLCALHHGYASAGSSATYSFGVFESGQIVAGFLWQPPPPGAAASVCPEAPSGVLSLSRMVAVDRRDRRLNHISKPLRRQMRRLIDRGRWPVLVTYHDEGEGHTGHVYMCSGWEKTRRSKRPTFVDATGARRSPYSNGAPAVGVARQGETVIQRWEHWACDRGGAATHMERHGWRREPIPGRTWRSGNQAHRWVSSAQLSLGGLGI